MNRVLLTGLAVVLVFSPAAWAQDDAKDAADPAGGEAAAPPEEVANPVIEGSEGGKARKDPDGPEATLPELTVTATRTLRDPFDLPLSVSIFHREDIERSGSFVALKAASRLDAGIWLDERTSTTTDLLVRGFSGFNLLALVDGNTLSTLWGEGGFGADDMYGKVDAGVVERIEVIRGPSSALYGSNALGAVINIITRSSPLDFTEEGFVHGERVKFDFASVSNAMGARGEFFGATPEFRFLLGAAARDFDHVRGGGDLGVLDPSDGRERNWDFSGELLVDDGQSVTMTLQDVHRDHIKRYYRPTQDNTNDREAMALKYENAAPGAWWDELEARLYYQRKEDARRFFNTGARGVSTTTTWQGGVRLTRDMGGGHVVTGGIAVERDEGDSPDDEQFTIVSPAPRRRDAPLSEWWDWGLYAQDEWSLDERWSLLGSARMDYMTFETNVDSQYVPPVGNPEDDEIRDRVTSFTGGLGTVFRASDSVHLTANWARGFRQSAPNFGLRQLGDGVLIPNELLDPTTSDNFEVGVKTRGERGWFDVAYYRSFIDNWQGDLRSVATYNGATYYDFNNNSTRDANEGFVTQVEGGRADVHGLELRGGMDLHRLADDIPEGWSISGSFAWMKGTVDATRDHPRREPLRHTQPMRGLLSVRWDEVSNPSRGLFVEGVLDMVDAYDDIPSDRVTSDLAWRRDPQDGTSPLLRSGGGVPGYTLFHVYTGLNLSESTRLLIGIENLTDKKYRAAHSRMDAPGVSLQASLEIWF